LEAQRLGLEAHASDLNPVAVLINKAMIEIPPRFAAQPPVNPKARGKLDLKGGWRGAAGLADDVRYYGAWMRQQALQRIGHLYPQATLPDGRKATVIAWLWARTVESPNPAFLGCQVPLVSSFWLSTKPGKEAWVEPVVEGKSYRFEVRTGKPADKAAVDAGTKLGRGATFRCLLSSSPIAPDYIRKEAQAGRMGARLMAIVAEGDGGRIYLTPTEDHAAIAKQAVPKWKPDQLVTTPCHDVDRLPMYGMYTWGDAFTPRQLVALTTFSDLVQEAREQVKQDALAAGMDDDGLGLDAGGTDATAYADAVAVYLACAVDKETESLSTLCTWSASPKNELVVSTFRRQALPMTWDFGEANPFAGSSGSLVKNTEAISRVIGLTLTGSVLGGAQQRDAAGSIGLAADDNPAPQIVSTDPPYYDNIGYADLSDFFYVWLRQSLQPTYPALFSTLLVPKAEELVATPYRHGSKETAETFFLDGMTRAMHSMAQATHPAFPVTIYYAFKQSEQDHNGTASTGWETFLEAVIRAGFSLTGTWPTRTERASRPTGIDTNALASSIVLVCRPRLTDAPVTSRRDFLTALKREMPSALRHLQAGNIAPVDLAQASIGPGMAIFTRYAKILESDGTPMRVRTALALINQTLDEVLAEQEGDFDADTGWAVAWFDQFGFNDGPFGDAETLCKAKNTAMGGLQEAGIAIARAGKVRLLRVDELPAAWDPLADQRLTVWESVHHLIRALNQGETAAAALVARLGGQAEAARELAYRLYNVCERRKRAQEAQAYNGLVLSWPEIVRLAGQMPEQAQHELF
jgi:putative DNA methylase